MRDKRRYSRTLVEIPVEFTPWDPKHVAFGFVTDLTLAGAAVSTEFPLPRGSHVVMRMWRPAWDEETVITGVVRWAHGRRMGVALAPMPQAIRDWLRDQLVTSRGPTSPATEPSPRLTTRLGALKRMLALVGVSACGGLSTAGLLPQTTGADGGRALGGAQIGEGGAALGYDEASAGLALSPPQTVDADAASSPADASADVYGDGANVLPGRPSDASAADRADLDAQTPCGALEQCCSRLIVAPPLAAACYVTAQSDGGAGRCGSALATFQDSGLCP